MKLCETHLYRVIHNSARSDVSTVIHGCENCPDVYIVWKWWVRVDGKWEQVSATQENIHPTIGV